MATWNRRSLVGILLLIVSLSLLVYQLGYSESARVKRNLDDLSRAESFYSSDLDPLELSKIERGDRSYSFRIMNREEVKNFKKLGQVFILDESGDKVSSFVLFKNGQEYLFQMRSVYMLMDFN